MNLSINEKKDRIAWIDIARGIAMVLVIYGHCDGTSLFRRFIYLFHVPVFFFISGYLFSEKKSTRQFLSSRVRQLLIPFLLFGLTVIFANWGYAVITNNPYDGIHFIKCMLFQIRDTEARIWFIPCLFLAESMLFAGIKIPNTIIRAVYFCILILFGWTNVFIWKLNLPWYPDTAAIAVSIMLLGYIAKKYGLIEKLKPKICMLISVGVCCGVLAIDVYYGIYVDMIKNLYGNIFVFYVGMFSGVTLIISVSRLLVSKLLIFIGKNTITFLCLNSICIRISWFIWLKVRLLVFSTNVGIIDYCMITLISVILLGFASMFINRYLPIFIGRVQKKDRNQWI